MNGEKVVETVWSLQPEAAKLRALESEIRTLETIRRWAIEQQPIKTGDRARLVQAPSIDKSSGWWSSRHFLTVGHEGYARAVRMFPDDTTWTVEWEPDDQTWIDSRGVEQPVSRPHVYLMKIERFELAATREQQSLTSI